MSRNANRGNFERRFEVGLNSDVLVPPGAVITEILRLDTLLNRRSEIAVWAEFSGQFEAPLLDGLLFVWLEYSSFTPDGLIPVDAPVMLGPTNAQTVAISQQPAAVENPTQSVGFRRITDVPFETDDAILARWRLMAREVAGGTGFEIFPIANGEQNHALLSVTGGDLQPGE